MNVTQRWIGIAVILLIVPFCAQAFQITVRYEGLPLGSAAEGETVTIPAYSSLTPIQQSLLIGAGLSDEYQMLGGTSLYLTPGCLDRDLVVDVALAGVPGALVAVDLAVEGLPGGYVFPISPRLTLPYGAVAGTITNEGDLRISYFVDGQLTTAGIENLVVDAANNLISADVAHFSTVAITEGEKQVPLAGPVALLVTLAGVGVAGVWRARKMRR